MIRASCQRDSTSDYSSLTNFRLYKISHHFLDILNENKNKIKVD